MRSENLTYGVIGTGAIGGYYGARLAQSGQEVCFLLHRDYDYVKTNGLQVDSCDCSCCSARQDFLEFQVSYI